MVSDPCLDGALAECAEAAQRSYYDAEADGRARDDYWRALRDAAPAGLFDAIGVQLERTHAHRLDYRPAVHLYPWVDLRPGTPPTVHSIYSGRAFDPRELIEADFRIEAERDRLADQLVASPGGLARETALSTLEAALRFNCEHVVPQSWFAKRNPMRGDLHHLFACEIRCNEFRGRTPYYDFPETMSATRADCGRAEINRFEPAAGKGAVARGTLYFLLRYPGEIDRSVVEYEESRLGTLLDWHRRFPPDEYERHRNAAIQDKQGNRNPLIDYPEWADRIDFARGLGPAGPTLVMPLAD